MGATLAHVVRRYLNGEVFRFDAGIRFANL